MTGKNRLTFILFAMAFLPCVALAVPDLALDEDERQQVERDEIVVREVPISGKKGRAFEAIGRIQAPLEKIYAVLTDYERYPEFMPNVSRVDLLEQPGGDVLLQYTLELPLGKIKKYRLRMAAEAVDHRTAIIRWVMVPWPEVKASETIRDTTGYWLLDREPGGNVVVLYHVYTDPGPVPLGLGWIVNIMTEKSVPDTVIKTRERVNAMK